MDVRWTYLVAGVLASAFASDNTTIWEGLIGSIAFRKNSNEYSLKPEKKEPEESEEEFGEWVNSVEAAEADYEGRSMTDSDGPPPRSVGGVSDVLYNKGIHYLMNHDLELALPEMLFGGGKVRISPQSIDEDGAALVKIRFDEPQQQPEGRIFLKKIKQIFKKKLMTSFMAAMLIIKLVTVKLLFLLPVIVGVGTAKKILLKVLLFIFPALAHLFKLCAYYHHHHSKYHLHHHHQIAHHHHHSPPPVYYPAYPEYAAHPPPGAEIVHRSEQTANELSSWGIEYEEPISRVYNAPKVPERSSDDLLQRPSALPLGPPVQLQPVAALPPGIPGTLVAAPVTAHQPGETFYTLILKRLDRVFAELGFTEEPCKERLVCSMYKAPARFSPHSNLVSAEISRDPSELEKPVFSNPAVIRFYRYVEAARSGQEGKDCLALFPHCSLLTE